MKERTPIDRNNLKINFKDNVLEIGSGHNPTFRSNVIVEKYIDSNYHRCGDAKISQHQKFVNADGANLPFKNKQFDYVICNHVLEHVDDPNLFVNEIARVGKRGYIELPSLIGESLCPKASHKWVCLEINNKLVLYDKSLLPSIYPNTGRTLLNFLPYQSIALRIFYLTHHQSLNVRHEWKDDIEILVNPKEEYYASFFLSPWTDEMCKTIFPHFSYKHDISVSLKVLLHLTKTFIIRHIHKHEPVSLHDYVEKTNKQSQQKL